MRSSISQPEILHEKCCFCRPNPGNISVGYAQQPSNKQSNLVHITRKFVRRGEESSAGQNSTQTTSKDESGHTRTDRRSCARDIIRPTYFALFLAMAQIGKLGRDMKKWKIWEAMKEKVEQFRQTMPLIQDLKNPALRQRHWDALRSEVS